MKKKYNINYRTIVNEIFSSINLNRGFVPTLKDLVIRPENVIQHYLNRDNLNETERKKYYTFGRFFITSFAIIGLLSFFYGEDLTNMSMDTNYQEDKYGIMFNNFYAQYEIFLTALLILPYAIFYRMVIFKHDFNLPIHIIIQTYISPVFLFIAIFIGLLVKPFQSENLYVILILLINFIYLWRINIRVFNKSFFHSFVISLFGSLLGIISVILFFLVVIIFMLFVDELYTNGIFVQELQFMVDFMEDFGFYDDIKNNQ